MSKKFFTLSCSVALLVFPLFAFGANIITCPGSPGCPVSPGAWFQGIIDNFLNIILWPIFLAVVTIMFIYAGFLFVTAAGRIEQIAAAKRAFLWAIVGVVVAILAFSIVTILTGVIAPPSSTLVTPTCIPAGLPCSGGIPCCGSSTCTSGTCQ